MTFGNVDLHLILGRPCVHSDDDLIVSHIALVVADMPALKEQLVKMGIPSRKNVSVPNPDDEDSGIVEQVRNHNHCFDVLRIHFDHQIITYYDFRHLYAILMAITLNFATVVNWRTFCTEKWLKKLKNMTLKLLSLLPSTEGT